MTIIRSAQVPGPVPRAHDDVSLADPLGQRAAAVLEMALAAAHVPSIRAIRAALHVGQPRAQRLCGYPGLIYNVRGDIVKVKL